MRKQWRKRCVLVGLTAGQTRKTLKPIICLLPNVTPKVTGAAQTVSRAEKLIRQGLMTKAGLEMIDLAKRTGTWTALEKIQNSEIPADLQKRFDQNKKAFENFQAFPPSSKQIILFWIQEAKRPETRQKRIEETVALAEKNIRANEISAEAT